MMLPAQWIPYCGAGPVPANLTAHWNPDPVLLAALALAAVTYWRLSTDFPRLRLRFAVALALALLLFVSPLCALGSALFSVRVVHHVLLVSMVAPLLVAAIPANRLRLFGSLPLWTLVQTVVFWSWHAPGAYGWALSSHAGYWLMQVSLAGSAFAFWATLRRAPMPGAVAALLATVVQMGLLGALITFAGAPLFAPHYLTTTAWGLTPLEDQQVAGLIMWAPAAGFYLAVALRLASRWLGHDPPPAPAQ